MTLTMLTIVGALCASALSCFGAETSLRTEDIRVRDPFIYADPETGTYYLYVQAANRHGSGYEGVEAYASKDLASWQPPTPVLVLPEDAGVQMVWAPEMHKYKGKYYLFVTLTMDRLLPIAKPVQDANWPPMSVRGTHIFRADSPLGPFEPLAVVSQTPPDWMALDGTLFVDEGTPYMVFCHEWVELIDGTVECVRLSPDLSRMVGEPQVLFRGSDAPGTEASGRNKVTDGCFLYRSLKTGRLFMIWSTFLPGKGYSVLLTESESGGIAGPWMDQRAIYTENGGHAMLFGAFDGRLMMALHQPNSGGTERLHLYEVTDTGEALEIGGEVVPEAGQ